MTRIAALLLFAGAPAAAIAYVGPGAGISFLGSLWGLIVAVVFVVFGLLVLPIKIMRNRAKQRKGKKPLPLRAGRMTPRPKTRLKTQRRNRFYCRLNPG